MSIFFWILLTFLVFLIVVLVHELGHFVTARLTGMRVLEFGFGIPPKVFRIFRDQKGTDYTFNALPIGGFVRIQWEDPTSPEADEPESFSKKSWWARALVLVAWVTMNFLFAIIILWIFLTLGTSPIAPNILVDGEYNSILLPSPQKAIESGYITMSGIILEPLSGSIADLAGIKSLSRVEFINGVHPNTLETFTGILEKSVQVNLILSSSGKEYTVTVEPKNGKIGTYIGYEHIDINKEYIVKYSPWIALLASVHETYVLSVMTIDILGKTVKNLILPKTPQDRELATAMVSWPIGIGAGFVSLVDIGMTWKMFFMIIAMLSINLGVINILPFPALDGGRLVSTTLRAIFVRGKSGWRSGKIEGYIHMFGMILLLALSLLIAFLDVSKML